jgi:outer membrane protein assembly factor BamB
MNPRTLLLLAGVLLASTALANADDWPQWRGPNRDGVSKETGLLKTWPKEGPKLLWTYRDAGVGYSGPAVVGDRVYCMGGRGDTEYLFALDVQSSKEVWAAKVGPLFAGTQWNAGPSATPTVDGGLVYGLGGQGILVCVDAARGTEVWRKDMTRDLAGVVNPIGGGPTEFAWGWNWSPLVDGDQLICVPGGSEGLLAALDKKSGKVLWRSKALAEKATYSSPVLAEVGGVRQVVAMTNSGAVGVSAKDGALLWTYKHDYKDMIVPTPILHDDLVFAVVGLMNFRPGVDAIQLTAAGAEIKAQKKYTTENLASGIETPILVGDHVYGFSESKRGKRGWVCMEFKSGTVAWNEEEALGGASVIAADGHLYCFTEDDGIVALVEAKPEKWVEQGRFTIPERSKLGKPSGKLWTPPVIANGRLYLRDQDLLFCYNISGRP